MYWCSAVNISANLVSIHVRVMFKVCRESMVLNNDGIEDIGKHGVGVSISSVDSTVLVIKLNSTCNSLSEGESRSLGLQTSQFSPFIRSDMFGNQAVTRPDVRERRSLEYKKMHQLYFSS